MDDRHRRRWDDTCPNCRRDFHVRENWDYENEFETECPHCQCKLHVVVESVPEFGIMRKDDYDKSQREYLEKIKPQINGG